jgi:uncharacterized alkaline shock family protein YloU
MADYVKINPHSKNGDLMISRTIFETIATEATSRVQGVSVAKGKFKLSKPVTATFLGNGKVKITVSINLKKGANAHDISLKIQERVANALMTYTESVPFDVQINIVEIE